MYALPRLAKSKGHRLLDESKCGRKKYNMYTKLYVTGNRIIGGSFTNCSLTLTQKSFPSKKETAKKILKIVDKIFGRKKNVNKNLS